VSLSGSLVPVFDGSGTKLRALSAARKVRRGDVIKLYVIRKADILRSMKLPANVKDNGNTFKVFAQEVVDWHVSHERKMSETSKAGWH
jgi:1,2-phenylacetyl-CoA epoxidase PaaB subunit